jgi:hypothetical protein
VELLPYLEQLQHRKNLLLIIPDEDAPTVAASQGAPEQVSLPPQTVFRNGVPLFPKREVTAPVTLELIKRLVEDE